MKTDFISNFFDFFKIIFYSLAIIAVMLTFCFRMVIVEGSSMQDTLKDNDRVIVTNYISGFTHPECGDIIAISPYVNADTEDDYRGNFSMPIIKRVIAVEGQTIGFDTENQIVYVDGKPLNEPYISSATSRGVDWDIPDVIPKGKVFVMGDNRYVSLDSRSSQVELIDVNQIIGKAQFVVFPFSDICYLYKGE